MSLRSRESWPHTDLWLAYILRTNHDSQVYICSAVKRSAFTRNCQIFNSTNDWWEAEEGEKWCAVLRMPSSHKTKLVLIKWWWTSLLDTLLGVGIIIYLTFGLNCANALCWAREPWYSAFPFPFTITWKWHNFAIANFSQSQRLKLNAMNIHLMRLIPHGLDAKLVVENSKC